ncbi:HNH endonuclease [Novilysobacter antarcticus]|uniref:HNH endonuclease n=1 Tax=Novilysobacter antarcticus TaxID=2862543 RepID=UPI001C992B9F|nr:HNH endonuclease [Lysobacter antarcticus]
MDGLDVAFVEGNVYSRSKEITGRFGGSPQGGIAHSRQTPAVFIFTGEGGEKFGYVDKWDDAEQVFTYTGEGQVGDMTFVRGNAAVRDHGVEGRALHLFKKVSRNGRYRYMGEMQCASTSMVRGPDKYGDEREIIQFQLVRVRAIPEVMPATDVNDLPAGSQFPSPPTSLASLRAAAYKAVKPPGTKITTNTPRSIYQRSRSVVEYVFARAQGSCECCDSIAPFRRPDGTFYLEAHHTERLSDNGLDSPVFVAAICPTCHRRIHHGSDGKATNAALRRAIAAKESLVI